MFRQKGSGAMRVADAVLLLLLLLAAFEHKTETGTIHAPRKLLATILRSVGLYSRYGNTQKLNNKTSQAFPGE